MIWEEEVDREILKGSVLMSFRSERVGWRINLGVYIEELQIGGEINSLKKYFRMKRVKFVYVE